MCVFKILVYFGGNNLLSFSKNMKVRIVCGPSRINAGTNP